MIEERILNTLLYLLLLGLDLALFALICALPVVLVGSVYLLFARDDLDRTFLKSIFSMTVLRAIVRGITRKLLRRKR